MFDTGVFWCNYYVTFHKSTCKKYRQPSVSVVYVSYVWLIYYETTTTIGGRRSTKQLTPVVLVRQMKYIRYLRRSIIHEVDRLVNRYIVSETWKCEAMFV